jgi:hypothetical protein
VKSVVEDSVEDADIVESFDMDDEARDTLRTTSAIVVIALLSDVAESALVLPLPLPSSPSFTVSRSGRRKTSMSRRLRRDAWRELARTTAGIKPDVDMTTIQLTRLRPDSVQSLVQRGTLADFLPRFST